MFRPCDTGRFLSLVRLTIWKAFSRRFSGGVYNFLIQPRELSSSSRQRQKLLAQLYHFSQEYPSLQLAFHPLDSIHTRAWDSSGMTNKTQRPELSSLEGNYIIPTEQLLMSKKSGFLLKKGQEFIYKRPRELEQALSKYDIIGFDMDHTVCQYRINELNRLLYKLHAQFLVSQRGYDSHFLFRPFKEGQDFAQKGLILDKRRGNILKLSHDNHIVRAFHGTKFLSKDELKEIYGADLYLHELSNFPDSHLSEKSNHSYYIFFDYFVIFASVICARIVDSLDAKHGTSSASYSFWNDVYDGLVYIFSSEEGFSRYIFESPETYIKTCSPRLKKWLSHLQKTKNVFLLSNSPMDFVSFLCSFCLGKEWQNYFDIVITNGGKPDFFKSRVGFRKFENGEETDVEGHKGMNQNSIYTKGNWKDLVFYFQHLQDKPQAKAIYFGDSFLHDVCTPVITSSCDTAGIVEEFTLEGPGRSASKAWGSFFQDELQPSGIRTKTVPLCYNAICKHATLIIPSLETVIAEIPID